MPFHAATKPNMAALLRSARLLRFSPSGLLQVTGTKRNGPPLSRLYGGAVGGRTRRVAAGVEHAPRQVWPCASGTMRGYAVATEQREDASLGVRSKQAQSFDWALAKLDSSVRRTGRITKTQLLRIFHDICRTGYPSGNQALLLLRSCGSLLPEMPLAERTELAHRIWDKLQTLAASYDASHYNALLKVYLQNEFKFSPTEFLAKMEAANVTPNRVTYQRLIAAYCQTGDIEGASTILGFMKSKDLPITEAVFNSLLTGHAKAGDLESAVNILPVMRGAGIEPGPDTYVALLTAYADKGDMENIKKTMETVEAENSSLMDRDLMQVIFALAMAGHEQHIPELVERMRHERGYVPDAMNLCLSLITQGQEDTAFTILKTFPTLQADNQNSDSPILGSFFLRHIVNMEKPVEKIVRYCEELQDANLHASPLLFALSCALEAKNTELSFELMKAVKQQGLPLRPHYFWPLLVQHVKLHNTAGVLEVLKGMQELGVAPDVETFNNYIIPVFPDNDTARQTLKEMGYSLGLEGHHSSEIRKVASSDLAALYTKLSDPSFPEMDLIGWRASLITGFRKSDNVEDMVKITEFLYNDPRFCRDNSTPIEAVAYFLYYLIDSMGEAVLQEQEEKLRQYFHKLKAHNIVIPYNVYRGIRNILAKANFHGLVKDVLILVDPNDAGANSFPRVTGVEGKLLMLEKNLAELKEQDKPLGPTLKQLILLLCAEDKLERALELKRQYFDEIAADGYAGGYAALINLCCRHGNLEEAINLKTELSRKDSSVALDAPKYLALVQLLTKNDRMDEAVDVLKEMKEKNVMLKENHVTTLFHLLNSMGLKGDIEAIRRIQDTVFTLGLTRPSANLCSPLISAYLQNNDMSGALEAAMGIHKMYKQMPRIHDIIVAMVEKGDTDLLQKTMDFVSEERGEMTMLYDLFFAFMQTGRYREARKIIETPGLRARPGRLHWYAEKCINNSQMEPLENMVEVTAKLFECDRDEMYHYMLRLCKEKNDFRKAEAAWTKMQEENVVPRERTLRLLADILKSNGQEVPFEEPETWYENVSTKEMAKEKVKEKVQENVQENVQEMVQEKVQVVTEAPSSRMALPAKEIDYSSRMVTLCKKKKPKEAYGLLKESEKKAVAVSPAAYDVLIRTLLAEGSLEDAMQVKDMAAARVSGFQLNERANSLLIVTLSKKGQGKDGLATLKSMLQAVQVPSALAITRLVQTLGAEGDAASIQEVDSLTKALGSPLTVTSMLFPNNMALAHIRSGDVDSAIEVLEALYTVTEPQSFFPSMSFVFRKVLEENNDKAMDKLSAMAERLANHFACYRPATDLFLELLEIDKVEDAKFMLARCNAVAEQKPVLLSYLSRLSQKPGNVGKVKSLMTLIPDFAEKDVQYGYMIKCFAQDNDLASAKDLHELMEKEGMNLDELSLKRLAVLYRNAGEAVPFTEPPESFVFYAEKLKGKKAQAAAEE